MTNEKKERMLELLSYQTVFGLDEREKIELEQLRDQFPHLFNNTSFDLTAAAINISSIKIIDMPDKLREKILRNSVGYANSTSRQDFFDKDSKKSGSYVPVNVGSLESSPTVSEKSSFWQWLGWGIAATACLLLAVNMWVNRSQPTTEIVRDNKTVETPTPELSLPQKRDLLIAGATDIIKTKLEPPKGDKNITGDVVWSNSLQKGYVTFHGLPVNDPLKKTYQLWVFDETQNDKYPINGGVFDVSEAGDVVIPISVDLKVKKPAMFAVTAEKPGGVVVSERENLVVIAKI